MTKEFADRLNEYLESELSDFSLDYSWEWNEDNNSCEVKIWRGVNPPVETIINFKFNGSDLEIELSEDSYYVTREYDSTVKYLWMLLGSRLFSK